MAELKPCPFCGEKGILKRKEILGRHYYKVECLDCFAATFSELTREEAIEAWNRRVDNE